MIKTLRMVNFKSFKDTIIDFTGPRGKPKKLAFIYGENGAGKSNIISALLFLSKSLLTLYSFRKLEEWIRSQPKGPFIPQKNGLELSQNIDALAKDAQMIGTQEEPMTLYFDFDIKGETFSYCLSFHKGIIVEESLRYPLENNEIEVFRFSGRNAKIHNRFFNNEAYQTDILEKKNRYSGKATFLSIMFEEMARVDFQYFEQSTNPKFVRFLQSIAGITVLCSERAHGLEMSPFSFYHHTGFSHLPTNFLNDIISGVIPVAEESKLETTRKAIDYFYHNLFSDVRGVEYDQVNNGTSIRYNLVFKKMIAGEVRSIPAQKESTGVLKLMELFPAFYMALEGSMVFVDEVDTGIHSEMMLFVLKHLMPGFKGQFIATTHNTLIMDALQPRQIYVINIRGNAEKEIYSLDQISPRIQPHHDVSGRYLKGLYGGAPIGGYLDPDYLHSLGYTKK